MILKYTDNDVLNWARYMYATYGTVRSTAKRFNVCKSTVHVALQRRLPYIDNPLYQQLRIVIRHNINMRAKRGGKAAAMYYKNKNHNV